jgi:hypothetical protein
MRIILQQLTYKREVDRARRLTGSWWVLRIDGVAAYRHAERSELVKLLDVLR